MNDGLDFSPFGKDLFGDPVRTLNGAALAKRFTAPPFSVLSARDGEWQERKRAWLSYGIQSELGREETKLSGQLLGGEDVRAVDYDWEGGKSSYGGTTASVFDPVVAELAYRWFCPAGGQIIDPFAGGSVRGIVAAMLGFRYWGCDLSSKQIFANIEQGNAICPEQMPTWIYGDSLETMLEAPEADFIFSCPPYGDLEVYSDDPRDISNMEYHTFLATYKRIIMRTCCKLKMNRFACFVVGDFRDPKTGFLRDFVSSTINAFTDQNLRLYNHAILVTPVGSMPSRAGRIFDGGRKLCKGHQDILVFVKGDGMKAAKACIGTETQ